MLPFHKRTRVGSHTFVTFHTLSSPELTRSNDLILRGAEYGVDVRSTDPHTRHMSTFPPQPCAGCHEHDDEHDVPATTEPCSSFISQGYGIRGDYAHSLYCIVCGYESSDHYNDDEGN